MLFSIRKSPSLHISLHFTNYALNEYALAFVSKFHSNKSLIPAYYSNLCCKIQRQVFDNVYIKFILNMFV